MRITRRGLQLALAVLWLLDAALQLQPFMFTTGFGRRVIAPAADGQPGFVAAPVHWAAHLIAGAPVPFDAAFAATQLLLALGLLWRRTARIALAASIPWALAVWWLGEGLGGIAAGHPLLLTGAPGAVLLYALLAALAWPAGRRGAPARSVGLPPRGWAPAAWAVLWAGSAVSQLMPGSSIVSALRSTGQHADTWPAALDRSLGTALQPADTALTVALAVLQLAIGLAALRPGRWRTAAATAGAFLAVLYWLFGQLLGELESGRATDPGTGPLLLLLAFTIGSAPSPRSGPKSATLTGHPAHPAAARTPAGSAG